MRRASTLTYSLLLGFVAMAFIPSCGSNSENDIAGPSTTGTYNHNDPNRNVVADPIATRECDDEMKGGVNSSRLEDFLQPKPEDDLNNIEPPVTYCLSVGGGSANFRIEFEANSGIFSTTFTQRHVLYATRSGSGSSRRVEVIFMDGQGLVQIKGTGNILTVKFHNFPSYEEAMEEAYQELYNHCKPGGDWTVAKCSGYGPPEPWWKNPTYFGNSRLTQARAILNNSSKTSTLGTIDY